MTQVLVDFLEDGLEGVVELTFMGTSKRRNLVTCV